jgi:hypothetical protein
MADIQHSTISDPHLHEPKGISTATGGTVYVATGGGSGSWTVLPWDGINQAEALSAIQDLIDDGSLDVNGKYWLHFELPDVSTAASNVIVPFVRASQVVSARLTLSNAITTADALVSVKNASGAALGTDVTIPFAGSGKGVSQTFTATTNQSVAAGSWIEFVSNGASDTAAKLYITLECETVLNP